MDPDAIDLLSEGTIELDIHDGPKRPQPLMNYIKDAPPPPHIYSKGVIATDISINFAKAAQKLDIGQLVKDEFFTLFESVGAIEIMDPKMDTGFLIEGDSMEDDYDIGGNLQPEELLAIIDQLFCLEMAWHMGHPLSQTIFTSLYVDRLVNSKETSWDGIRFGQSKEEEPVTLYVLRAYCLGLLMTCSHVNNRIKSEHFYEEEDFVTHTYNQSLLDGVEDTSIIECLNGADSALSSLKTGSKELKKALHARLGFRLAFLKTISASDRRELTELINIWDGLIELLPDVSRSKALAEPIPEAFSSKLQRKLASTVPPRPVVTIAFETAYDHLERLCHDARAVIEVLNYHDSHSLMTFVLLFHTRKPQPSVYIRTLLQYYIFGDMIVLGKMSIRQLLDDDLSSLVLTEDPLLDPKNDEIEVPHDPRFNMAQRMELFRERAAHSYLDILRTLCQNRCRTRRDLTHCIADWENLQMDGEELDLELREFTKEIPIVDPSISPDPIYAFPLSSWAYFYKLRQMEWIVQIGFELEVYQADELAGMYWFLQYLTQTRIRHVERIRGFVMRRFKALSSRYRNKLSQKELGFGPSLSFINYTMLEATAIHGFADALSCFYTVLQRRGLTPRLLRPYSNDALRYELRMKPFLSIGLPEFLPYKHFHSAVTQPEESANDLIAFAAEAIVRARKDFELLSKLDAKTARYLGSEQAWQKNVKDSLKACISASISISVVKKAMEKSSNSEEKLDLVVDIPAAGKGYHDWWAVPKVTAPK